MTLKELALKTYVINRIIVGDYVVEASDLRFTNEYEIYKDKEVKNITSYLRMKRNGEMVTSGLCVELY